MELLNAYIPMDRQWALAQGDALPDRTHGAALFADISGFTPLTEALARTLGPRRGAEELTGYLNVVYTDLIQEVHRFRGSVIAFAGDAITCWFEGDDGRRGLSSALALQAAMQRFGALPTADGGTLALHVKVGLAVGKARRFLVGAPEIQCLDTIAGSCVACMAVAGQQAARGDVVIHPEGAQELLQGVEGWEWLPASEGAPRFAVVRRATPLVTPNPWPEIASLSDAVVRPYLLRPVYDRLRSGQGEFLTELRPAVAVFIKFEGIDYDGDDDAGAKLDEFVIRVQRVLEQYEGFLVDVSIGDKGSYLYAAFGAPIAHENDPWRALAAAIEIRALTTELPYLAHLRTGISCGTMRTGAYGGPARRTYGILGDQVNVAARLMEHAASGQIVVSGLAQAGLKDGFSWEALAPLKAKGKSDRIPVFALLDRALPARIQLTEPEYGLPMVGRAEELAVVEQQLKSAAAGSGRVLCLAAEAGMGKSRLVAEAIRLAVSRRFSILAGQGQPQGRHMAYLPWVTVWREYFGLDDAEDREAQIRRVEGLLDHLDPALTVRSPLLASVLQLTIPDNDTTRHFDPKLRKSSLEALLVDCLRHRTGARPMLLVIEDGHWLDALSSDLLHAVAGAAASMRLQVLATYRPREMREAGTRWLTQFSHCTELGLRDLSSAEAGRLVALKIAQRSGPETRIDPDLLNHLVARSAGNPFFIEQLLNYLFDRGIDLGDPKAIAQADLPSSLHGLVLGRIDRLGENPQVSLKVASVYGRTFPAEVICRLQPARESAAVRLDLADLDRAELTAPEPGEPEETHLFRHAVTQEVAYESLTFQTRTRLHNEIGLYLEERHAGAVDLQVDTLAFHFDRSPNDVKKREYLLRAGRAAQSAYANAAAISYYQRVLPLLDTEERIGVMLDLGRVLEVVGQWKEAAPIYREALGLAEKLGDRQAQARCETVIGDLLRKEGRYAEAQDCLHRARALFDAVGDEAGVAQTLHIAGTVEAQQGAYDASRALYMESLRVRRKLRDKAKIANLLNNLGIVHWYQGEHSEARALYESSLLIRRELGDQWSIANSLNNLGLLLRDQGDTAGARGLLEECLTINRQLGDRWAIANALSGLGDVALSQRDQPGARAFLVESLAMNRELGDRAAIAFDLEFFGQLAAARGDASRALRLAGAAAALRESIGGALSPAEQARLDQALAPACGGLPESERQHLLVEGRGLDLEAAVALALEHRETAVT